MKNQVAKSQLLLNKGEAILITCDTGHPCDNFLSSVYGFMTPTAPLLSMPPSHLIWDEWAQALPNWVNSGTARQEIAKLPLLDASKKKLNANFLSRASTILTILAHAYYAGDFLAGDKINTTLPLSLYMPWQTVAKRLKRKHLAYTIYEGMIYNWKYKNPLIPIRLAEHTKLLVPLTGTQEESISHMVLAEAEIKAAPFVLAMVKAQNACLQDNKAELENALITISHTLRDFIDAFMKINLIPGAQTYLHPIIWSHTAPVISAQYTPYELGMSGGSLPSISLMDAFLGRTHYKTEMGRQELARRALLPPIQQQFIKAIAQFSVGQYLQKIKNKNLIDIWDQLNNNYCGERGFFQIHRRKIFNYIQMGMKAGRAATNAHYSKSKTNHPKGGEIWDEIDEELEQGRQERYVMQPYATKDAVIKKIVSIGGELIVHCKALSRLVYYPGDRCTIYVENTKALINKTLTSLQALQSSKIELSVSWINYLTQRLQKKIEKIIPLTDFLRYAKIRPLTREITEKFYKLTNDAEIKEILDNHLETQFELWDFLLLLQKKGYDLTKLWQVSPWQQENLSKMLPPEPPRAYSLASVFKGQNNCFSFSIKLLHYQTEYKNEKRIRSGTASAFFNSNKQELINKKIQFAFDTPLFFPLKNINGPPLFFFAGGVGIAAFISILTVIYTKKLVHPVYVFFSVHDLGDIIYEDKLIEFASNNAIQIFIVCSTSNTSPLSAQKIRFFSLANVYVYYGKRIPEILAQPKLSKLIFFHLKHNLTHLYPAKFFICGGVEYCQAIENKFLAICNQCTSSKKRAAEYVLKNIANKALSYDVFTGYYPNKALAEIPVSELAKKNNHTQGYWMAIDDLIYNVSEYAKKHPGGDQILFSCSGLDASHSFKKVEHHLSTEIMALLSIFKIGKVKKLNLNKQIHYLALSEGLKTITMHDFYELWVKFLFELVEIENRLYLAYSPYSLYKKNHAPTLLEAEIIWTGHLGLCEVNLLHFAKKSLAKMWAYTLAIYKENEPIFKMQDRFKNLKTLDTLNEKVMHYLHHNQDKPEKIYNLVKAVIKYDHNFIRQIKYQLIKIHQLFEKEPWNKNIGKQLSNCLLVLAAEIETYPKQVNRALSLYLIKA